MAKDSHRLYHLAKVVSEISSAMSAIKEILRCEGISIEVKNAQIIKVAEVISKKIEIVRLENSIIRKEESHHG